MKRGIKKFLKGNWIFLIILILVIIWFAYSYFNQGIIFSLIHSDSAQVVQFVESFGIFAALIFVFLVILEVVLAPMPPLVLYIVAGFLFGGFLGGVLTLIGNLAGAMIDFKIARKIGRKKIEKTMNKNLKKKFDKFFDKHGALSIFILRINPLTTSDLVSYLAGLTKIKPIKFLIATGVGLIPLIFIQTYLGDVIKNSPIISALVILFSIFYLLIFIYLIFKTIASKKSPAEKI